MNVLVVMARYPRVGRVKTRLAATIGPVPAARLYRAFLADVAGRFGSCPGWKLCWAFEPPRSPFRRRFAAGHEAFPQPGGDLGRRMAGSIEIALSHGARNVVLIGSDLPHLEPARVAEAFARLAEGAGLVIGPAEDGGYYLIGARDVPPVFDGIPWGRGDVLERTLERARSAGRPVTLLAPCFDLDRESDLRRLGSDSVLAGLPATAAVLREVLGRGEAAGGK